MSKVHNITGIIAATFIIVMLFILMIGADLQGKTFNEIYVDNKGLIWGVGLIIGVTITVMTYITGIQYNELNERDRIINSKEDIILTLNNEILELLKSTARGQVEIAEKITLNSENDLKTKEQIQKFSTKIDRLFKIIDEKEQAFIKEITEIKAWINVHEKDHNKR